MEGLGEDISMSMSPFVSLWSLQIAGSANSVKSELSDSVPEKQRRWPWRSEKSSSSAVVTESVEMCEKWWSRFLVNESWLLFVRAAKSSSCFLKVITESLGEAFMAAIGGLIQLESWNEQMRRNANGEREGKEDERLWEEEEKGCRSKENKVRAKEG